MMVREEHLQQQGSDHEDHRQHVTVEADDEFCDFTHRGDVCGDIEDALSERVAARVAWRFNALAKHHGLSALAYAGTPAAVPLVIAGLEPAAGNRWRLD